MSERYEYDGTQWKIKRCRAKSQRVRSENEQRNWIKSSNEKWSRTLVNKKDIIKMNKIKMLFDIDWVCMTVSYTNTGTICTQCVVFIPFAA